MVWCEFMAHMHPSRLTPAFSASRTPSEARVYDKAAGELSHEYHVFHDLAWDDPSLDDSKTAGQIDFVIVQPEYGFVTLEVKGGRCRYEPDLRSWSSLDRHSDEAEITDPFDQAAAASRVIRKLLSRLPQLAGKYLPHHHAVIFPDCVLEKRDLRANVKAWQILDQESLFDFDGSVRALFARAFPGSRIQPSLGQTMLKGLSTLYGDVPLQGKESTAQRVREISERLVRLTTQQLKVLILCREHRFCLINGCAGSGKTMLALHKAKMLAEDGNDVLLVCFNQPLAQHLQKLCEGYDHITVGPFLELCLEWLANAGHPLVRRPEDTFYAEELPNHFTTYVDVLPQRFDAIVVDEGQDFKENYWLMLEMLFRDSTTASFYIFSDGGQNIYRGSGKYPVKAMPLELYQNVRNTNQIFSVVKKTCQLPDHIEPSGVDGPTVQFASYTDSQEMLALIKQTMAKLVGQHFGAGDVVLLGTKSQRRTALVYGTKIGPYRLVEERHTSLDLLTMTVHRFKGLESPVVILTELDEDLTHNLMEILYIGLTRPIAVLYVLYHKRLEAALKTRGFPLQ